MSAAKKITPALRKPAESAASGRALYDSYKFEVRGLIVILVVLIIAAGQSLSVDRETEPVFFGSHDLTVESEPRAAALLPSAPLAAPVPAQVTVVTVPAAPAPQPQVVVIREPGAGGGTNAGGTTRTTLARYPNGGTPPVVRITRFGPQNQDPDKPVELAFQAGDADGVISGWLIDWGDGTTSADAYDDRCGPPPGEPDHDFPPQRHTYRAIGRYEVSIRVVSRGTCEMGPVQRADARAVMRIGPTVLADMPIQ